MQSWGALCHIPGSVKMVLFDDVTIACSSSDGTSNLIRILRITNRGAEIRNEFSVPSAVLCLCVMELSAERAAASVVALATGCQDGVVRIWRHINGGLLMSLNALQGHPVAFLLFAASNSSRHGPCIIASSSSGVICSWDLQGVLTVPILTLPILIVDMHLLSVSDKLVVFGNDNTVRFLRVRDFNLLSTITLYNVGISRALVSELPGDSKSRDLIIAGSVDGTISVHSQMHLLIGWQAHKGEVSCVCATLWSSDSSAFNRRCFVVSAGGAFLVHCGQSKFPTIYTASGDHRLRVWLLELRQSDEGSRADALPLLSMRCIEFMFVFDCLSVLQALSVYSVLFLALTSTTRVRHSLASLQIPIFLRLFPAASLVVAPSHFLPCLQSYIFRSRKYRTCILYSAIFRRRQRCWLPSASPVDTVRRLGQSAGKRVVPRQ